MATIKTITFDLDDTLWNLSPVLTHAELTNFEWLCRRAPELASHFDLESFKAYRINVYRQQPALKHQISEVRKTAVFLALQTVGYTSQEAQRLSQQAFDHFLEARHQLTLFDGAEALLDTLKSRYRLGALSNGNADIRKLPISKYFDFAFSAEQLDASKPAPDLFWAALKASQSQANELIHIGDHIEHDIQGALGAGCHAIWFNPLSDTLALPNTDIHQVQALDEIPELITAIEINH